MIKTITFITSDGGAGKTSCSHLLALGAIWNDIDAAILHTDKVDPPAVNRPYHFFDCRNPQILKEKAKQILDSSMRGLMIIDGGANMEGNDKWLAEKADLNCIPVKIDPVSIKHALKTEELVKQTGRPYVFVIVGQKSNSGATDKELLSRLGDESRIVASIKPLTAVRVLVDDDPEDGFITPPPNVNKAARELYSKLSIYW